MLMDQLLKKVKAALADRAEWQIYDAYDPTPFDKRPDWFLTVGISGTEMQSPFLSGICTGHSAGAAGYGCAHPV